MRIAQIAPLYESCPPQLYGGTERVVSFLTEELVRLGHDVTLFASGDSKTAARLVPGSKRALRLDTSVLDPLAHHMVLMNRVIQEADDFDILHFHTDYLHYPFFANSGHPMITTLHGRQDLPDLVPVYREFPDMPLISISDDQRRPISRAHWVRTVHHGLPLNLLPEGPGDGRYLAFVGRISPEKRLDRAIVIARQAGIPLKVAAKIDRTDTVYYEDVIKPLLGEGVEFIGEINDQQKKDFLGRACALLFPVDWPEPFGLVMIEAMACGTPVLAFRCGSVPEVIDQGVTGLIVDSMEAAHTALPQVLSFDRHTVRAQFEKRFSAERMARDYLAVYEAMTRPAIPIPAAVAVAKRAGERLSSLELPAAVHAVAKA